MAHILNQIGWKPFLLEGGVCGWCVCFHGRVSPCTTLLFPFTSAAATPSSIALTHPDPLSLKAATGATADPWLSAWRRCLDPSRFEC